jgi:hypothetical protein
MPRCGHPVLSRFVLLGVSRRSCAARQLSAVRRRAVRTLHAARRPHRAWTGHSARCRQHAAAAACWPAVNGIEGSWPAPAVGRAIGQAVARRSVGPILRISLVRRMDRHSLTRRLQHPGGLGQLGGVAPGSHMLRPIPTCRRCLTPAWTCAGFKFAARPRPPTDLDALQPRRRATQRSLGLHLRAFRAAGT